MLFNSISKQLLSGQTNYRRRQPIYQSSRTKKYIQPHNQIPHKPFQNTYFPKSPKPHSYISTTAIYNPLPSHIESNYNHNRPILNDYMNSRSEISYQPRKRSSSNSKVSLKDMINSPARSQKLRTSKYSSESGYQSESGSEVSYGYENKLTSMNQQLISTNQQIARRGLFHKNKQYRIFDHQAQSKLTRTNSSNKSQSHLINSQSRSKYQKQQYSNQKIQYEKEKLQYEKQRMRQKKSGYQVMQQNHHDKTAQFANNLIRLKTQQSVFANNYQHILQKKASHYSPLQIQVNKKSNPFQYNQYQLNKQIRFNYLSPQKVFLPEHDQPKDYRQKQVNFNYLNRNHINSKHLMQENKTFFDNKQFKSTDLVLDHVNHKDQINHLDHRHIQQYLFQNTNQNTHMSRLSKKSKVQYEDDDQFFDMNEQKNKEKNFSNDSTTKQVGKPNKVSFIQTIIQKYQQIDGDGKYAALIIIVLGLIILLLQAIF